MIHHPYSCNFKLHVRWQHSVTRITYVSKLIGMPSLAALRCTLLSIALAGQREALFKTSTFCPET
ncbi:hypothetical protein DMB41_15815 [Pectobacterium carotovorum subsp. carotovorum]|nr:hypothetical protein DMB41_15815 [Pectobacterium carotovorum subsp. carotovorum]